MVKSAPVVTDDEWAKIKNFYAANAAQPPEPRQPPDPCAFTFKAKPVPYPAEKAFLTYLQIDSVSNSIRFSDIADKKFFEYTYTGQKQNALPVGTSVTDVLRDNGVEYLLGIGDVYSFRDPRGFIYRRKGNRLEPIVTDLLRPASIISTRGLTQTPQFLVADFGLAEGQLISYNQSFRHADVIFNRAGATGLTRTRDGRIFLLTSQAVERLSELKYTDGKWIEHVRVEYPPSYGGSSLRAADLDGDGTDELIVTHGDNGDFISMPLRPYHGIRIYTLSGKNHVELRQFYPMYGAYKTAVADFDGDGFPDIAATAYFYDKTISNPQKLVILQSHAGKEFSACSIPEASRGRWMGIDAGDLNGDGKPDIVLGGAYFANFDMGDNDGLKSPTKRSALMLLLNSR